MNKSIKKYIWIFFGVFFAVMACRKEEEQLAPLPIKQVEDTTNTDTSFTPKTFLLKIPFTFPVMKIPVNNPLTVEGVNLGKKLFFDKLLSVDQSLSCASCHMNANSFSDNVAFSKGVNGLSGTRNAMPLFNLGWSQNVNPIHAFMWDGGVSDLESQVLLPIQNPVEMNESLVNIEKKLRANSNYKALFKKAFNIDSITIKYVMFAIAQYERTLISAGSKWDLVNAKKNSFSQSEKRGETIFFSEKGACFHCHNQPFFTNYKFRNNGLDSIPTDRGFGLITGNPKEDGMFKVPSLRNLAFTAPYMHDGRFNTIEEVIEFYDHGMKDGPNTDGDLKKHIRDGGLLLTAQEKKDLLAFLNTLNDYRFVNQSSLEGKAIFNNEIDK